ncbi:MAG: hypothetical protein ABI607_02885 [Betaproteobacteria bacterium]
MAPIQACPLPEDALLCKYLRRGAYADCFVTEIARHVSHAEFVEAFYTTALFKAERLVLTTFVSRPSTDLQARELATGKADSFAAWTVEARGPDQLLLCDFQGRTRSWLLCVPVQTNASASTRLYFGSAVVPKTHARSGEVRIGVVFSALLGFHKHYSRALLRAAASRLERSPSVKP